MFEETRTDSPFCHFGMRSQVSALDGDSWESQTGLQTSFGLGNVSRSSGENTKTDVWAASPPSASGVTFPPGGGEKTRTEEEEPR